MWLHLISPDEVTPERKAVAYPFMSGTHFFHYFSSLFKSIKLLL